MARFNLEDYVQVNDRIVRFWDRYPDGTVLTELLHVDDHCVRFKAAVYASRIDVPGKPLSTGHAEEYRITEAQIAKNPKLQHDPNVTSALENCETSAVGRAMAMAGFEVSKSVASRQEMEKVRRQEAAKEADRKKKEVLPEKPLDKADEPAKVEPNGDAPDEHLTQEEAREAAKRIKQTGMETTAMQLKLVAMGIEGAKTVAGALQVMTKQEAQEFESWVVGETTKS